MTYTSVSYFCMVLLAVPVYYLLPKKFRWAALLFFSGVFYVSASERKAQLLMFAASILISYGCGRLLGRLQRENAARGKCRAVFAAGIVASALPLLVTKCGSLLFSALPGRTVPHWILPVGLSFYSLQVIAYLADVYRRKIRPQENVLKYALFVSFFPLIVQGPISRYDQLGEQLFEGHDWSPQQIMPGIQRMLWGLFLKLMVADKAAVLVNAVFDRSEIYSGVFLLVAAVLYSIQLYADFSACVVLSQGVAELFGIRVADNFRRPYFSASIREFWRNWHISLSNWLRDYVYIPLGGNRKGERRKIFNLLAAFFVSGVWHGYGWQFVVWGLLHALYQIMEDLLEKPKDRALAGVGLPKGSASRRVLDTLFTFFLVTLAWIIFRAPTLKAGLSYIASIFTSFHWWVLFDGSLFTLGLSRKELTVLSLSMLLLLLVSVLQERGVSLRSWFNRQNTFIRWIIYLGGIWSIWVFGTYGNGFDASAFIYGGF